jgi:pimeloyl-ACP methyl ester carboxylesterase
MELVELMTADSVDLVAALIPAATRWDGAIDGVIVTPGTAGTFATRPMLTFAEMFAAAGVPALSLGTRGHDLVWRARKAGRYMGAAYEDIRDTVLDIEAALSVMEARGLRRIALVGHSLGGVKMPYYAAHRPEDPRVAAVVSCSGPRWSASHYLATDRAAEFQRHLDIANGLVAEGRGGELFEMTLPVGPFPITASGYLDKYGGENFNQLTWAHQIRVPFLRVQGAQETPLVQYGFHEELMARLTASPAKRVLHVDANHQYAGKEREIVDSILGWLREAVPSGLAMQAI